MCDFDAELFPRRLKALREERGMDQAALAKASGISKGTITRYETGQTLPRIDKVRALSHALNCSGDVLMGAKPLVETI